ncbi:hypothetical protein TNCV_4881771 [Trichonephila clavipes]|nr:hypothetical protein TNCV_4881771 [Trichonephila clavipes]
MGPPHTNTIANFAEIKSRFIAEDDIFPFRVSPIPSCVIPLQTEASVGCRILRPPCSDNTGLVSGPQPLGHSPLPRNSSWQWARCTPVIGLSLEHHAGDSTISLGEITEGTLEYYDRWHHHLSPPPQFRHGTVVEGIFLQFAALVIQIKSKQY